MTLSELRAQIASNLPWATTQDFLTPARVLALIDVAEKWSVMDEKWGPLLDRVLGITNELPELRAALARLENLP